jgi:hypothetical protein
MKLDSKHYTKAELNALRQFRKSYSAGLSSAVNVARKKAQEGVVATTLEHAVMGWATWAGMAAEFQGPEERKEMDAAQIEEWWEQQEQRASVPMWTCWRWRSHDDVWEQQCSGVPAPRCDMERRTITRVAYHIAWAIRDCDDDFFKRIAKILRHYSAPNQPDSVRSLLSEAVAAKVSEILATDPDYFQRFPDAGFNLLAAEAAKIGLPPNNARLPRPLEARQLHLHRKPNRGFPSYSLACVFPTALRRVIDKRLGHTAETEMRITKAELLEAILEQQKIEMCDPDGFIEVEDGKLHPVHASSHADPPKISVYELSRQLTKAGFNRFMAEQPITKKRRK